jgi:hypothetical protein
MRKEITSKEGHIHPKKIKGSGLEGGVTDADLIAKSKYDIVITEDINDFKKYDKRYTNETGCIIYWNQIEDVLENNNVYGALKLVLSATKNDSISISLSSVS